MVMGTIEQVMDTDEAYAIVNWLLDPFVPGQATWRSMTPPPTAFTARRWAARHQIGVNTWGGVGGKPLRRSESSWPPAE
jgi:hypothetical protein